MKCIVSIASLVRALLVVGATLGVGCRLPGKPDIADRPIAPHEVQDFASLYGRNCAGCHGAEGKLGPAPPLNDPIFLAIVPDDELLRIVRDGRHGTLMPGFARAAGGSLTDEQARIVSAGIKVHFRAAGNALSTNYPPYGVEKGDAQHGKEVFGRACAQCHGADGQGTKHAGAIHDAAFLALVSDQALRRIIITGRPDLQMPNYAESSGRPAGYQPLTSSEIDDLVALLAQWRRTPRAGSIASSRATIDD